MIHGLTSDMACDGPMDVMGWGGDVMWGGGVTCHVAVMPTG